MKKKKPKPTKPKPTTPRQQFVEDHVTDMDPLWLEPYEDIDLGYYFDLGRRIEVEEKELIIKKLKEGNLPCFFREVSPRSNKDYEAMIALMKKYFSPWGRFKRYIGIKPKWQKEREKQYARIRDYYGYDNAK